MELGEKIRQARLEAGLSQRRLCGGRITRNMLSQIENGSAKPSMDTLRYLAEKLGKSVSFFLEDDAVISANQALMAELRSLVLAGEYGAAWERVAAYREPDPVFDAEFGLLRNLTDLGLAEAALSEGKILYARRVLQELGPICDGYCREELERRRLLLLAGAQPNLRTEVCAQLPGLDEELLLRAGAALDAGDGNRCVRLLEACGDWETPEWNLLRAEVYLAEKEYGAALACFRKAEAVFESVCLPKMELCCKELGDFQGAYGYACRQRG